MFPPLLQWISQLTALRCLTLVDPPGVPDRLGQLAALTHLSLCGPCDGEWRVPPCITALRDLRELRVWSACLEGEVGALGALPSLCQLDLHESHVPHLAWLQVRRAGWGVWGLGWGVACNAIHSCSFCFNAAAMRLLRALAEAAVPAWLAATAAPCQWSKPLLHQPTRAVVHYSRRYPHLSFACLSCAFLLPLPLGESACPSEPCRPSPGSPTSN